MIWCLIAGKLMSLMFQFLLIKLFKDFSFSNFNALEKSISWFLVEHVFEHYRLTSGKFFMINEDFRRLITNFFKIVRDLIYWSHIITINELFTLVFSVCCLIYLSFVNFYSEFNTNKYTFRNFMYCLFIVTLMFKIYFRYTKFDVLFVLRPLGIWFDCVCILFCAYLLCLVLYNYVLYYNSTTLLRLYIKYLIVKSYFYFACFCIILYSVYLTLFFENTASNNFIQELTLKIVFVYTYLYYSLHYFSF
jgi:hypothetical protein